MDVNSKEYWNNRFNTDWKDFDGNEQTKFFASILGKLLPEWLIHEINENAYYVCDLGCAEGDSLKVYRQIFLTSELSGEDFSEKAVEAAKIRYPEFSYKVSDIMQPMYEEKYPVVICSNVVEHFRDTYKVLCKICERSTKYTIVMIPYREKEDAIEEHMQTFHTENIPLCVEGNYLVYAKNVLCESIYYPYEQILLVYAKDVNYAVISDIVENVESDNTANRLRRIKAEYEEKMESALKKANAEYEEELDNELKRAKAEHKEEIDNELKKARAEHKEEVDQALKKVKAEHDKEIDKMTRQLEHTIKELGMAQDSGTEKTRQIKELTQQLDEAQTSQSKAYAVLQQKNEYITQAQELCDYFATGKLMKLNHFLFRIKGQLLKGTKSDRKDFWAWLRGRIRHTNRSLGAGIIYNPLMVINRKLQEAAVCHISPENPSDNMGSEQSQDTVPSISESLKKELAKDYTNYDVIILSVIDYNFRHQRPQHFATRFAANGHRVFYVNANFIRPDSVTVVQENLYVVDFSNDQYNAIYAMDGHTTQPWMQKKFDGLLFEQGIRDAVIVVDYPNWVKGAEFLREKYGFKIITDYMDDYTGFLGTAETFLKDNCIHLLQTSDMIAASSQFLFEVAASHTDRKKIEIIRNGTEVNHFYQAAYLESPDKKRSIIGYYGAVAHWFAWEKVCYLASRLSECDIVIVGDVTEHRAKLEQYSNIKLLGEKPYQELPKYLADFDVCLIPFDTSTDLIKATNPVKFYEYLSAGKKVVATEIPELMPYRNEYVYMSNEEETFVEYVKLCLEGKDCLKGREDCITFARENDWQKRYEAFESACIRYIPKVSIIVLTYNNLELNKQCIDSILRKTAYGNYDLIIVDNKSTDGTVEYLKSLQLQDIHNVKIILNDENLGFAGGNNVGIKAASGDYVLLLNNDTVVSRGWLTAMVKHMENNLEYGMCNPVTNSIGNESMIKVRYHNAQELSEFAYITTANNMNMEYSDVDKMPLFATIIRKEMIDKIGMLDESYKIGMFEDDDYLEAALEANYGVVIAEDSFVHHINNGTFRKMEDEEYKKIFETNKKIFEEKWNKKWHMPKYRFGINWNTNEGMGL